SQAAVWTTADATIAAVNAEGAVTGLKAGWTKIKATALADSTASASAWVHVLEAVSVASVAFDKHSLELYLGGAPESLLVTVLPALANQSVDFTVGDPTLAVIEGRKVRAIKEGETFILVKSHEN